MTRHDKPAAAADSTAVRVALWRALHVEVDPPPHVLEDEIGLRLVAPDDDWRRRPDMDPDGTRPFAHPSWRVPAAQFRGIAGSNHLTVFSYWLVHVAPAPRSS